MVRVLKEVRWAKLLQKRGSLETNSNPSDQGGIGGQNLLSMEKLMSNNGLLKAVYDDDVASLNKK